MGLCTTAVQHVELGQFRVLKMIINFNFTLYHISVGLDRCTAYKTVMER